MSASPKMSVILPHTPSLGGNVSKNGRLGGWLTGLWPGGPPVPLPRENVTPASTVNDISDSAHGPDST